VIYFIVNIYMDVLKTYKHHMTLVALIAIGVGGLYFYLKHAPSDYKIEGMTGGGDVVETRCPNILIQKGAKYYLYNSKLAKVPGVNPISFNNLEEYTEFLEWQRGAGIRCPVLYVQNTYNAQGERVYKIRPSATDTQGGLPPSVLQQSIIQPSVSSAFQAPPENVDFDESLLYKEGEVSPDPMDPNWGGAAYTQKLVDAGVYKGSEVSIAIA
jgi:hypothetical protein